MSEELSVLARGRLMGRIVRKNDKLRFDYDVAWSGREAFPLSVSMPVSGGGYGDERIAPYLANLLPDNENTIGAWAKEFHTSTNPFALLRFKGSDCPGAIQLVSPERVEDVLSGAEDEFVPLSEDEITVRLREVIQAATTGARTNASGQFSLAGAQPKLSLAIRDGRWVEPRGRFPTTRIIKPAISEDGMEVNEHFCLSLARRLGLETVHSEIIHFGSIVTIVVERYDRRTSEDPFLRIHQEDLCQALGLHPRHKYQNESGPSARDAMRIIRDVSSRPARDAERFLDALLFNFIIAGTDAHAKNYSFLLPDATTVRLAPLYDMASALPYLDLESRRVKFAMKIGSHYALRDVSIHDWKKEARALGLPERRLVSRMGEMLDAFPAILDQQVQACKDLGLAHPVVRQLTKLVRDRVRNLSVEWGRTRSENIT